jgi:hypothetical protein
MDKIEVKKLWTQAAYAKKVGLSRARINYKALRGQLKTVKINGAILIVE